MSEPTPINGRTFKLSPASVSEFRPLQSITIKDLPTDGDSTQVFFRLQSANEGIEMLNRVSTEASEGDVSASKTGSLLIDTLTKTLCSETGELFDTNVLGEIPLPVLHRILREIHKYVLKEVEQEKNA